jgi:acyl-CoA reductase-like NAD-dependent aldehyde dehydrogenase
VRAMQALVVGDPMDPATQVGPLAGGQLVDDLDRQVQDSVRRGARILAGGTPIRRAGFFFEPTVLNDIPADSPAYRDELFGPVASLFRARDAADAIRIANDTRFGLGASAWTSDPREAMHFARELQATTGCVSSSTPRRCACSRSTETRGSRDRGRNSGVSLIPPGRAGSRPPCRALRCWISRSFLPSSR